MRYSNYSLGFQCPNLYNPAEYYVKMISDNIEEEEREGSFIQRPVEILEKSFRYNPNILADNNSNFFAQEGNM